LWPNKERTNSGFERTINVSRVYNFPTYHMYLCKKTNHLEVKKSITNKSLSILEASRRILDTHCMKNSVLVNTNFFKLRYNGTKVFHLANYKYILQDTIFLEAENGQPLFIITKC